MSEMGMAMMGTGRASGAERARTAAELAISSPLLDDIKVAGAKGLLVNVTAAPGALGLVEMAELNEFFDGIADADANFKMGVSYDAALAGDEVRVTIIATGLGRPTPRRGNEQLMVGPGAMSRPLPPVASAAAPAAAAPPVVIAPAVVAPAAPAAVPVAALVAPMAMPPVPAPMVAAPPRPIVRVANGADIDYAKYEAPAVQRHAANGGGSAQGDLLNVPAFLRRQAD